MKLTKQLCDKLTLPAGKSEHIAWDSEVANFGLRLRRAHDGSKVLKSWTLQYRHGGRKPRIKLGDYAVLSVEQARTQARKILGRVANGEDPASDRRDRRDKDAHTLKATAAAYLAAKTPDWAERTAVETERYLADSRYFGPLLGMAIDTISLKDVAARIVVIQRERGNATANRARSVLGSFFSWCMKMGLCSSNPCIGSINPPTARRERVLSDDELARVWRACRDDDHGRCVRLVILLGARRQEIGSMSWPEFSDLDGPQPTWTLPANRSKNKRAHELPMLPMALAIVKSAPHMASRDYLFGTRANGFVRWSGGKKEIDERSGVQNWTTHDLRRTTATRLGDLGVQPHVVEQILNHQSGHKGGIAGVYNQSTYQREVLAALALWEDHIRTLITGGKRKVLRFHPQQSA
jgi:integrase